MRKVTTTILAVLMLTVCLWAQEVPTTSHRTTYANAYMGRSFEEWLKVGGTAGTITATCAHVTEGTIKKGYEAWLQFKETVRAGEEAAFPMPHTDASMLGSSYVFRDKRLAGIFLMFTGKEVGYETQLANLTRKYGSPVKTESSTNHDAYGASWTARTTTWEMPDGATIKLSDGEDRDHMVTFVEFRSKEDVSLENPTKEASQ
jgi:hypothetical protein